MSAHEQQSKQLAPLQELMAKEKKILVQAKIRRYDRSLQKLQKPVERADYARDFERGRNWLKTTNYQVWLKGRTGKGIYASWKDDNFLKWSFKECFKMRTMPWLGAGIFTFILFNRPTKFDSKEEAKDSMNLFPFGYPPGSDMPHLLSDIVSMDMPKLKPHVAPASQGIEKKRD